LGVSSRPLTTLTPLLRNWPRVPSGLFVQWHVQT